ncbi:MAG TPA: DUF104 domain-containing protein [Pyrodictium sp.]|nr:DUF104 domain-containing protein [Pyrodictium sp.]
MARTIRVRYERGMPLEEPGLREGEEAIVGIEKHILEPLKNLVGLLGWVSLARRSWSITKPRSGELNLP